VFTRTGGVWSQEAHIYADDAEQDDLFGNHVGISGDSIVVSAGADDTSAGQDAGSAYVFTRTGSTWSQQDHLFADDGQADDIFGSSVAISGNTVVVGAHYDGTAAGWHAGSAYVFTRTGSTWSQQDHLFAGDAAMGDCFGGSVAIDDDTIVVGASSDDTAAGEGAGSAYVFTRSGGVWSQQDQLFASDAATGDCFGGSVAIDGDTIVVGAHCDDTAVGVNAGSVYVFTRTGGVWSQQGRLFAKDAASGDLFGLSVAIDHDSIVAGAPWDTTNAAHEAGSAYVFIWSFLGFFVGEPELPSGH
jgi:hypothetical protein